MWRKKMKVFISWSGDISLKVALIFRDWLPSVIQSIEPYVSSEDIDKGARWSTDIAKELENSTFGILCVTKENLEAPWLSFEAGALSKTMEKSFVTPFLFDIKRSEVQGPILQFQSTIFQKDDIKKMVKTLNKACGDTSILDARLDKAFDVWYPTLERELNELKSNSLINNDNKDDKEETQSSEILEEILELSRDNQKLLRNPDSNLINSIEEIRQSINENNSRTAMLYDRKRRTRKYNTMFLEELVHTHMERENMPYGFLMILSFFKDDFPWIYDMGKELLEILKSERDFDKRENAIKAYREMIDFTCSNPIMRDMHMRNSDNMMIMKEMPYILMNCLETLERIYQ